MDGTERNIFETTNHHCSQVLWTQESYCDIVAMLNPQAVFIRYQMSSARDSIHIRATVGSPDLFLEIALRLKHQQRNIANCYTTYWIFLPQNHISRITVVSYCSTYWMLQEQMSKINQLAACTWVDLQLGHPMQSPSTNHSKRLQLWHRFKAGLLKKNVTWIY